MQLMYQIIDINFYTHNFSKYRSLIMAPNAPNANYTINF